MKAILGSLLCFVLFASQCFALKGGPPYPGGTVNITGTYAGVLTPTQFGVTALGIFSLGIPQVGLASGSFLVFILENNKTLSSTARTYVGTIQGVVDPSSNSLSAVVQGIPIVTTGDTTVTTLGLHADGELTAKIRASHQGNLSLSSTLITGTGSISVSEFGEVSSTTDFLVSGFLQSTTVMLAPAPSGSPSG